MLPGRYRPVAVLRISDADRERVATFLQKCCGEGRLRLEELEERLDRTFDARTGAELAPLVADLPGGRFALPGIRPARERRQRGVAARVAWACVLLLVMAGLAGAAATAPLELALGLAVVAVAAALLVEVVIAALPAVLIGGFVWYVVRALRARSSLGLVPPPR